MMKEINVYRDALIDILNKISGEILSIREAANAMAASIIRGEAVHVIGPGMHSNMAAEEVLWRAGGLAPINALLDAGFNPIHGSKRSNMMTRTPGYAIKVLDAYGVGKKPGEVIIIVNAYGINAMCIDTVMEAKRRKMTTIGITSKSFADALPRDHPARDPSGKNLYQEVDHFINCHMPYGDTVVEIEGCTQKTGPVSSICNIFAINLLIVETAKTLVERGVDPPLYMSANMPGGDEANLKLEEKYRTLIKHL
jgi:uncharacterized phosphosugar-binding protein